MTCVVVLVLVVLGKREVGSVCLLVLRTFLSLPPACQRGHELCRTRVVKTALWEFQWAQTRLFVKKKSSTGVVGSSMGGVGT